MVDMVYQLMYQVFSSFFDAQLFASTKMIHPQCKSSSWKSNIRLLAKMSGSYPCKLDGEMVLSCLGIQLQHREMCTSISSLNSSSTHHHKDIIHRSSQHYPFPIFPSILDQLTSHMVPVLSSKHLPPHAHTSQIYHTATLILPSPLLP